MLSPFSVPGPVEIIAHRGFSARAPENTLAALELALGAGADAVEFDVHTAKDGTPFLFHDTTLPRTTNGAGRIRDWVPERLAQLDAGSWFGREFRDEPIPPLEVAFSRLSGRVGRIYAEIKGYREIADVDGMVALALEAGVVDRTVFISMDWEALDRVRSTAAQALVGYIVEKIDRIDGAFERASGDRRALLDFDRRILLDEPELAERARAESVQLATWTVNEVEEAERLLEIGVPRITTNEVGDMVAWKASL